MPAARSIGTALAVGVVAFLLSACGGAPAGTPRLATTQAPGSTPAGPGAGTPATGPTATPAPAQPPAGGGVDVQDPCGLATVEEVSDALGEDVVEAEAITGDTVTYCNYRTSDGTLLLAISFSRGQAFLFDSFKNADDAIPVPGVGEDAVVSSGTLFIKQGDAVVGIQPAASGIDDPQEIVELVTELGRAIAGRL